MSGMLSQVIQRDSKLETELVVIDENNINAEAENAIKRAGEVIRRGGLVAFPTETVYGLGGDALNPESSKKIYAAKGRPSDNPLIVHIADIKDLELITDGVSEAALKLAKAYWPGPLTMIMNKSDKVPLETTGGLGTVAIRMPNNKIALEYPDSFSPLTSEELKRCCTGVTNSMHLLNSK